jgi:hypothetical protein
MPCARAESKKLGLGTFLDVTRTHSEAAPSKKARRGDLQPYTDNSSYWWCTLDVDLGKESVLTIYLKRILRTSLQIGVAGYFHSIASAL